VAGVGDHRRSHVADGPLEVSGVLGDGVTPELAVEHERRRRDRLEVDPPEVVDRAEDLVELPGVERRQALLRAMVVPVRLVGFERANRFNVWVNDLVNRGSSGDPETVDALTAEGPSITTDEFAKVARAMTRFVDGDTDFDLAAVTAPALVIYGENELGLIERHSRALSAAIPDATLQVVPGGGHASNRDAPEFFTAALREFLAERVHAGATTGS
jgi:pimeloyl-ACP methyl ester carboxylesterase